MKTELNQEKIRRFANACIDTNTVLELQEALNSAPDNTDMREWNLTEDEYEAAIKLALREMSE